MISGSDAFRGGRDGESALPPNRERCWLGLGTRTVRGAARLERASLVVPIPAVREVRLCSNARIGRCAEAVWRTDMTSVADLMTYLIAVLKKQLRVI
jgi:hypothetical protein